MLNIQITGLKKVSKVYRERLVAAGFTTVQAVVDGWDSDELWEAIVPRHKEARSQLKSAMKEFGYEIVPVYKLRKIVERK